MVEVVQVLQIWECCAGWTVLTQHTPSVPTATDFSVQRAKYLSKLQLITWTNLCGTASPNPVGLFVTELSAGACFHHHCCAARQQVEGHQSKIHCTALELQQNVVGSTSIVLCLGPRLIDAHCGILQSGGFLFGAFNCVPANQLDTKTMQGLWGSCDNLLSDWVGPNHKIWHWIFRGFVVGTYWESDNAWILCLQVPCTGAPWLFVCHQRVSMTHQKHWWSDVSATFNRVLTPRVDRHGAPPCYCTVINISVWDAGLALTPFVC